MPIVCSLTFAISPRYWSPQVHHQRQRGAHHRSGPPGLPSAFEGFLRPETLRHISDIERQQIIDQFREASAINSE
eukprot:1583090-Pyramimonas_sp.AAC.1